MASAIYELKFGFKRHNYDLIWDAWLQYVLAIWNNAAICCMRETFTAGYISANLLAAYIRSGPEWPNAFKEKSTAFTVCVCAHWHSTIARLLLKSALAKSGPWHKCVHLAHPKRLYIVAALSSSELDLELYKCNKLQWTATAQQQHTKNAQRTGLKFVSYKSLSYR